MTPKEKAEELIDKFANAKSEDGYINTNKYRHKQCALITVDEVLSVPYLLKSEKYFYTQVKQEIENI